MHLRCTMSLWVCNSSFPWQAIPNFIQNQFCTPIINSCTLGQLAGRSGLKQQEKWYVMCLSNLTNRKRLLWKKNWLWQWQMQHQRCMLLVFPRTKLTFVGRCHQSQKNMFDNLPLLSTPTQKELQDELDRYLNTNPKMVEEVLMWWHEHQGMYPHLSCMVLDYLMIPGMPSWFHTYLSTKPSILATSVNIEHIFSCSHLMLSHVHSQLSAQSTWALLCLGLWSLLGLVKDSNVLAVTVLQEVEGDEEPELEDGWDHILV